MNLRMILEELETLPKGYISQKRIKGKYYYYYQYPYLSKLISKYIKYNQVEELKNKLDRRKLLEKRLALYKRQKPFTLSVSANKLTGTLMNGIHRVALFNNGKLVKYFNKNIAPIYIKRTENLEHFLETRTLDLTRSNARFLLKQLEIYNKEQYISLYSYAATIQDQFWFKPLHSKVTYKDIRFDNDIYADIALEGKILNINKLGSSTPELTTIGSYEKCWRLIDNKWYLYKKENDDELYSEYFVYLLADKLKINVAKYELDGKYIRSLNFATKYNFEPIYSLAGDNEDYVFVFNILLKINKEIAKDYIKLIWFDTIVYNVDRHNHNYGVFTDRRTGNIISLAPNFDNNMALLSYNKTLSQDPAKDSMVTRFINFVNKNNDVKELTRTIIFPVINEKMVDEVLNKAPKRKENDQIKKFILDRYCFIKSKLYKIS